MGSSYETLYKEYIEPLEGVLGGERYFDDFVRWIETSQNTLSLGRKQLQKQIDPAWVEIIEESLPVLDRVTRNPRRFIKDEKEILPIELSRSITAESIRHLAQHSNMIDRIEGDQVIPSKILNVYKEESLDTYENKFVNTLLDRLFLFIHRRYDKLREAGLDESCAHLRLQSELQTLQKGEVTIRFEIETKDRAGSREAEGASLWERVERIQQVVDDLKRSPFAQQMKGMFVRPPIMRTNAIMKNQDLKQCLVLWQYIEGYDKIGYEINSSESVDTPDGAMVKEMYELFALHYLLFRRYTAGEDDAETLKRRRSSRPVRPRILKSFEEQRVEEYNFYEVEQRRVLEQGGSPSRRKLSRDELLIRQEITGALASEKKRRAQCEAEQKARERRRLEQEKKRLESEKRREQERLEQEKRQRLRELAKEEQAKREQQWQEQQRIAAQRRALEVARLAEERLERLREAARQKLEREIRLREEALKARKTDFASRQVDQNAWRQGGPRGSGWKKH